MALFGKKQKDLSGIPGLIYTEDEILGYLDELFRLRLSLTLRSKKDVWECGLYFIDLKRNLLRIEDSLGLKEIEGKSVQCGFSLDNSWFIFQSKLQFREGKPHLSMPTAIKHHERRKNPRVALSPREQVRVSALQSLGAGIGITGVAVNVSIAGICIKIERALKLENEQKVPIRSEVLPKGTELMIVKIKNLPGVPSFDVPGIVNRLSPRGGGTLAVEFPKLPAPFKKAIEKLVESRYLPYRPIKRSYKRRQEMERERQQERETLDNRQDPGEADTSQENGSESSSETTKPGAPITFVSDALVEQEIESPAEEILSSEPETAEPLLPILLSLGDELEQSLYFLKDLEDYEWIHVGSPLRLIKFLRERKTAFIMLPPEYNLQSMVEYLEKMSGMGILNDVGIIILTEEPISPKDLIKCRMLGIQHTIQLPLKSPDQILKIIAAGESSSFELQVD